MKRLSLLLTTAIACCLCAMAQDSRVATLQHGANFRTYYGTDAFISAHNDASDGDVITLTAGEFNGCEVTKALTIRGEGMDKTVLTRSGFVFNIPKDSHYSLSIEGLRLKAGRAFYDYENIQIKSSGGSASALISKCHFTATRTEFNNCSAVIIDSHILKRINSSGNSSVNCINSIITLINGSTFDVNNCVIDEKAEVTNSIIRNSIIYGVTELDNTNTTSHCLVKYGSSGFANSWYVKTEPDVNPDPWGEDPETPVLWDDLFGDDYNLTEKAAKTYLGTDGTQVGIYGGAYPYDITPDYPLVKTLDVKGIHEDGKLRVKINVQ